MGNIGGMVEDERGRGRPRVTWTDGIKAWMGNIGGMVEDERGRGRPRVTWTDDIKAWTAQCRHRGQPT